jgi:ABC-type nitrate/sulfonate/bicarbonate transport system substrate-binding protein
MESTTLSALRDLAAGRGVKRGRHDLSVDGEDHHALFLEALRLEGFEPARVRDVDVEPGERVPAFLVRGDRTDFGWVFWEKFTDRRSRKLFGSVVRNEKGDWEIQLGAGSREEVYARLEGRMDMDPDRPSSLG